MRYLIGFFYKKVWKEYSLYLEWELGGDLPWGRLSHSFLLPSAPFLKHRGLPAASTSTLERWTNGRNTAGNSCVPLGSAATGLPFPSGNLPI